MAIEPSQRSDSEKALEECEALEADLAVLKVAYEQYFLGAERHPPSRAHDAYKQRINSLKTRFLRSTLVKFRVQGLHGRFLTYERLWTRTLQEIEAGTYRRDLFKAKRRAQSRGGDVPKVSASQAKKREVDDDELDERIEVDEDGEASPSAPAPAAPPPPKAAPPPAQVSTVLPSIAPIVAPVSLPQVRAAPPKAKAPAAAVPGLSEERLKVVYEAYVQAKRRNNEDTSKMSFETVAASLRKQVPDLLKAHKATQVDFKIVLKDGKAMLKAVPK